ncbi:MAG: DUF116 domain-containing protein [Deltaproteobacteria bacterium]|nr:DUF116 domain-containing protein [Deltaproteobacteria bacterium]
MVKRTSQSNESVTASRPVGLSDIERTGPEEGFDDAYLPSKGTFIVLLLISCLVLVALAFVLWWVPYKGLSNIHRGLPLGLAIVFGAFVLFGLGGALTLVFTIVRGKNLFFNRRIRGVVIRVLFPLLVAIGKIVGIGKDRVQRSFVAINNQLVLAETKHVAPDKLLILLPHCLQYHDCAVRITGNVANCQACGRCKIKDLAALSDRFGVPVAVATGGTLARRIVVEKKPEVIIGVACERDLTSGIQDSYPIPVYGILNRRPFGPCYDTDVDLALVEKGILTFLECESGDTERSGACGPE